MTTDVERHASDTRIASTEALLRLDLRARQDGLNRLLTPYVRERLDPDGFHVLSVALPFHNGVEASPYPHHRVSLLLKLRDSRDPVDGMLDLAATEWPRLPLARDLLALARRLGDEGDEAGA